MNDEVRCPGCQRLRARVTKEVPECREPRNAFPKRCVWRQLQGVSVSDTRRDAQAAELAQTDEPSDDQREPPPDLQSSTTHEVPDNAARELHVRLAALEENLRRAEQAERDQRAEADEHRKNANALQLKIDEMQHAAQRLQTEAETQRSAAQQHQRAAAEAVQNSQSVQEKHRLLETAKRELEQVHAQAVVQIEKLQGARGVVEQQKAKLQAAFDKTREEFESTLRQTRQELDTARANISQQVSEQIRKQRWLMAGVGVLAGVAMGIAGSMMLSSSHRAPVRDPHVEELLTQMNGCLTSVDWVCVGIASARILAVNATMPVALAAQREAKIAQQQAETAEAQQNTERIQHAQEEKIAAQMKKLLYANQVPNPAAAAQAACPQVGASDAQGTIEQAVSASMVRERAKLMGSLMNIAEGERQKGAFDCAEDLALIAQTYGQPPSVDRFIGKVRKERQDVLNRGVVVGK